VSTQLRIRELRAERKSAGGDVSGRHVRAPWSLPLFAGFVSFAFILVTIAPPIAPSGAMAVVAPGAFDANDFQSLSIQGEYTNAVARDAFSVTAPPPPAAPVPVALAAPAAGSPDPGTAQAIAWDMLQARGQGADQFDCLVALWNRESHWNVYAMNSSSGAYGIPQALPGEKMASAGADWATNPATQISWGLGYIEGRYGTPCGAWEHSETVGWY
jgi:hypothetical protein